MKHYFVHPNDENKLKQLVWDCDRALEDRIDSALDQMEDPSELRLFGLTGPTCAGKTTAAKKITAMLEHCGMRVHVISVDDFYYDKEYLHKLAEEDPDVEIDYDSERTIDIALFAECTQSLLEYKETQLPRFDFQSGMRVKGQCLIPRKNDVFLFEGIQILYPSIDAVLSRHDAYRSFYICPASSIEVGGEEFLPNEIRLCRRLVRDYLHRATLPDFTFYLWESVRANEDRNIFPYVSHCHATIDSTMPYEMGMLKPYLEPLLCTIKPENAYYGAAQELLKKLRNILPVPVEYRTQNSLYKEFI